MDSIFDLQRKIGNHAVQRLLQAYAEETHAILATPASARFPPDCRQMPVFGSVYGNPRPMRKGIAAGNILSNVRKSAQRGFSGNAGPLPHLETIQQSFGHHALKEVKAFVGGPARNANEQMGSTAYAANGCAAFKQPPDLRTASHEAAHIVQQRAGVPGREGVGKSGDRYERIADAVAESVVQGHSAEHLLDQYPRIHPAQSNFVQFNGGVCEDLLSALRNSTRVIDLYEAFMEGDVEWQALQSQTRQLGNAAQGVTGAGLELPQIVQDAINEVEEFGFEELRHAGRLTLGLPSIVFGSGDFFHRQWVANEIERQNHYNLVLIRYMYENSCTDFPGQWTDYVHQVLPIGTRGLERRSSIESPRETRTALAWVAVGDEHVLVLATEVAGSGRLRFERWIDRRMRDLALRQARDIQGTIPTVPSSAVTRFPSSVPGSTARR